MSPTITPQHIEEEDEPRNVITDDVTTEEDDHDYAEAIPPIHDVYAVPNRSRNTGEEFDDDVNIVDNDMYTEDHGDLRQPSADNDVTIVDNVIYIENDDEMPGLPENNAANHTYYNTVTVSESESPQRNK